MFNFAPNGLAKCRQRGVQCEAFARCQIINAHVQKPRFPWLIVHTELGTHKFRNADWMLFSICFSSSCRFGEFFARHRLPFHGIFFIVLSLFPMDFLSVGKTHNAAKWKLDTHDRMQISAQFNLPFADWALISSACYANRASSVVQPERRPRRLERERRFQLSILWHSRQSRLLSEYRVLSHLQNCAGRFDRLTDITSRQKATSLHIELSIVSCVVFTSFSAASQCSMLNVWLSISRSCADSFAGFPRHSTPSTRMAFKHS